MLGKIARLPRSLRDQVNRRLDDAQPHQSILDWLNALPEAQAILAQHFDARPVTKQNLYDWTQHGFRNWKLRQDAFEFAHSLAEDSDTDSSDPQPLPGVKVLDHIGQLAGDTLSSLDLSLGGPPFIADHTSVQVA